jgi:hypothetical protein
VTPQELERRLSAVRLGLGPAEGFLSLFAAHLGPPILYQSVGTHIGFRYTAPDARHFCLLKGVRAVSGMNACINLAIGGYTQEIGVIIRTIVECTSLIDWVKLEARPDGSLRSDPQRTYVKTYFEDYRRDRTGDSLNLAVRQKDIHQDVGAWLDDGAERVGIESSSTARLMSTSIGRTPATSILAIPKSWTCLAVDPPYFTCMGCGGRRRIRKL